MLRASSIQRLAAAAIAVLWALAPVGAVLHETESVHRYCAEHDGLEDVPAPARGEAPADLPDHETCPFGKAHVSDRVLDSYLAAIAALPEPHPPDVRPSPAPPVSPLTSAPKTSPPAPAV